MLRIDWTEGKRPIDCRVCSYSGFGERCAEIRGAAQSLITAVRCPECDSVMLDVEHPREYSDPDEVDEYIESKGSIEAIARNLSFVPSSSVRSFLDIGCHYGFGPHVGREVFGWAVTGVEPGVAGRRGAQELGLEIRADLFDESTEFRNDFDLILASEVVEHVPDPLSFLRAVRSHIAEGGHAVFTTPAAEAVANTEPAAEALIAISPGDHVFLASARGLEKMLDRAGWENFAVRRDGRSLTAIASGGKRDDLEIAAGGVPAPELIEYFDRQADVSPIGSSLRAGMASRHFRALVNLGRFNEAEFSGVRVVSAIRERYGVDLADVKATQSAFAGGAFVPLNAVSFAYHCGMLGLGRREDADAIIQYFDLAILAADLRYERTGADDADSADLRVNALRHRVLAAARAGDDQVIEYLDALREKDTVESTREWSSIAFEHLLESRSFTAAQELVQRLESVDTTLGSLFFEAAQVHYRAATREHSWSRARQLAGLVRELRPLNVNGTIRGKLMSFAIERPRLFSLLGQLVQILPTQARTLLKK